MAKIALLIGVSEYEPGLNPLPAAVKDLDAMKEVLLHPDVGEFAESDIMLLKNPRRQEMEESIETLFANRHRDDLVLLFFSGHGIKDDAGRLYLATSATRKTPQGDLVRSSAVSANFVHENMSRSRSKRQVVILDSCFSGAFAEGLLAKDDGTVDLRTQLGGEGRAVLTSSSSTQYSFEQEGEELSLYTRFLIEGIKTGEADLDGDDVVSIDELHEYASRKVREVKPELKPEIYAIREGFKIRLCKVPQGDPHERYKKEVARCGKRGELTIVSRSILDTWRLKLGLSVDEVKALEDEVLEPYRRDFQQKLKRYEQTVTDVLQRDGSINDNTRQELQQLQQVLELRNEDTVPIEARVTAHLKTRKQNLETYKQSFSEALRQEHPLGEASRSRLQQMQQQLALSDADVAPIEAQITTEVEIYRRNLQQYEQAFLTATQQEYPLSDSKRAELRQHQQSLGLSDAEIAPIEAKVTTQIKTYHQKMRQYEEAFASATQRKHQPGEANRTQLRQTWQTLELNEADVKAIEAPILAQIETYQANLRQYDQAFVNATEQEYPLSETRRSRLRQLQQTLSLSDEDIAPIENRITALIEDHLKKLQQYEQVFSDSIQFEFPVSAATRKELWRFQQVLELKGDDVARVEEKLFAFKEAENERNRQEVERQRQEQQTQEHEFKLNLYEQKLLEAIQTEYPLSNRLLEELKDYQQFLALTDEEVSSAVQPFIIQIEHQRQREVENNQQMQKSVNNKNTIYTPAALKNVQKDKDLGLSDKKLEIIEKRVVTEKAKERKENNSEEGLTSELEKSWLSKAFGTKRGVFFTPVAYCFLVIKIYPPLTLSLLILQLVAIVYFTFRGRNKFVAFGVSLLISFPSFSVVRTFIFEARYVVGTSMLPTLQTEDRVIVDKTSYFFSAPSRGDLIVFAVTETYTETYTKLFKDTYSGASTGISRVIGVPGDKIEIKDGKVYLNDNLLQEKYVTGTVSDSYKQVVVPPNSYFVLGDNRGNSFDSKYWGFLPRQNIIGKIRGQFWPLERFGIVK